MILIVGPNAYYAGQSKTLMDYVQWCLDNGQGERASVYIERA